MNITLEARLPCVVCGHQARLLAFPPVRVNQQSIRQLPGEYLCWGPGVCDECGTDNHGVWARVRYQPTAEFKAQARAYRAKHWPELAGGR